MILENNILYMSQAELVQEYGCTTLDYLKKATKQHRQGLTKNWRHVKAYTVDPSITDRRYILIDYDTIPESTRVKLPSRSELVQIALSTQTEDRNEARLEAEDSLKELYTDQYCRITDFHFYRAECELDERKANDLMLAAGWLRLLNSYKSKSDTRQIGFESKASLRESVLDLILEQKEEYGRFLYNFKVQNVRVLQNNEYRWRDAYKKAKAEHSGLPSRHRQQKAIEAALTSLVHGNFGNRHSQKLGKLNTEEIILIEGGRINLNEWHAAHLMYLYMNPGKGNKFDFEEIYIRYQMLCEKEGKKPVSISTVKSFFSKKEVKQYVVRERDGYKELDKLLSHHKRKKPEYSLSKGGYDGFQVDFYTDVQGIRTMLTVVTVFDYYTGAITGFDVGIVENGLMVRNMYRNHLNLTEGRSYVEIESDRFSGNRSGDTKRLFEKCCQYIRQGKPSDPRGKAPNPKERYVERLGEELNRISQNVMGWKGTNITSQRNQSRKPNPDYGTPSQSNYAHGVQMITTLINIYNNQRPEHLEGMTRIEAVKKHIHPESIEITPEMRAMLLNQHTVATVRNGTITIEVNRRKYEYEFPDSYTKVHRFAKGYKVRVYYDETDMESVDVFSFKDKDDTGSDTYIATLGKQQRYQMAKIEQTEEDVEIYAHQSAQRNKMEYHLNRKELEWEASLYGIVLPVNATIKEMEMLVQAERERHYDEIVVPIETRFNSQLNTPEAKQHQAYYEDRLLRDNGIQVPVKSAPSSNRRDMIRRQYEATIKQPRANDPGLNEE